MSGLERYAIVAAALLCLACGNAQAGFLGNDFNGVLYDVSATTGATTNPRATGLSSLVDVEFGPDGALYGLTTFDGPDGGNRFYRVNPTTGAAMLIGATGLAKIYEGDLAYNARDGKMYGVQNLNSSGFPELFTIDLVSGNATVVGNVGGSADLSGMAFDGAGNLWVLDQSSILRIDPATGATISSSPLSDRLGFVVGMAFDPASGSMFVVDGGTFGTNTLYTMNTGTGVLTAVGPLGNARGLAGLAIPAPGACWILATSAAVMFGRRRRAMRAIA